MRLAATALACVLTVVACSPKGDRGAAGDSAASAANAPASESGATAAAGATTAAAAMKDSAGHDLGTLTLADTTGGILVTGTLHGLPPGEHAIHVHTVGQCQAPFTSAGGHWNPTGRQHGSQNPNGPHFGDLPNITVGKDSSVTVHAVTPGGTLRGGANALLDGDGAAVVVHASADDHRTDPAGNAGARIACGVARAG